MKKTIKGLLLGSMVLASAQADFLMTLTDKAGVEESLCVKSYSFSNNLESLHRQVSQTKDVYSTEETLTNKIYMGKPVYRRISTIKTNLIGDSTEHIVPYSNAPKNYQNVIKIETVNISGDTDWYKSKEAQYRGMFTSQGFMYILGKNHPVLPVEFTVILEYTKTTDIAQDNTTDITTLVHYLPSDSTSGEYITKSTKNLKIGFFEKYSYDASTDSCTAVEN